MTPADAAALLEGTSPGPWVVADYYVWAKDPEGRSFRVSQSGGANGDLIAAAPALAAALAAHEGCVPLVKVDEIAKHAQGGEQRDELLADVIDGLLVEVTTLREQLTEMALESVKAAAVYRARLDEAELRYIEATNPGIDMEHVKRHRAGLAEHPEPVALGKEGES